MTAPISHYMAWHGFGWDHLAFSQLLLLVREKQLGQGLLLVWIVALLLWRVRAQPEGHRMCFAVLLL